MIRREKPKVTVKSNKSKIAYKQYHAHQCQNTNNYQYLHWHSEWGVNETTSCHATLWLTQSVTIISQDTHDSVCQQDDNHFCMHSDHCPHIQHSCPPCSQHQLYRQLTEILKNWQKCLMTTKCMWSTNSASLNKLTKHNAKQYNASNLTAPISHYGIFLQCNNTFVLLLQHPASRQILIQVMCPQKSVIRSKTQIKQ